VSWVRVESPAYWICFVGAFLGIAVWESFHPVRELSVAAGRRWRNHGALFVIVAVLSNLLLRVSPVLLSVMMADSGFGILNKRWLPITVRCGIAVALLDLLQYGFHWSFHHVPWLWRIHQVHHSDPDYDVSTAVRFHPLETLCSQAVHLGAIAVLAAPPAGVLIAELLSVILNLSAHANGSLPPSIDQWLRLVFVTPDLHRVHHSRDMMDQQRNLGQTFAWWDYLFGTYTAAANAREETFRTGLTGLGNCDSVSIGFMLAEPFRNLRQESPDVTTGPLA
jgi:sterol desaturase/sphingolipid hydroxylase (fatty acid hydroxylase superfamily)